MTFDRLLYIDRLKEAGVEEPVARAHAEALREALLETVATKAALADMGATLRSDLKEAFQALDRRMDAVDRKIDITARDLTIRAGAGALTIIGLKVFG